ncbi:MAG: sensor histidine kinase [Acidobacteriota bacterium]
MSPKPPDRRSGWVAYIWLVYAALYVVAPLQWPTPSWTWPLQAAGVVVFLALYLYGLRADGSRRLLVVLGLTALGASLSPVNPGALVFFIYAASFVAGARSGGAAGAWIGGVTLAGIVAAWLAGWTHPAFLGSVAVFTPIIGFVNLHEADVRRRDASLRLAQDEIARLAARAERDRIAGDLHDLLGHTLSVIVLKSELASKLAASDVPRAAAEMAEVERIARGALTEVRATVQGYRAATLADEVARARSVLATAGIAADIDAAAVDVEPRIEHALALVLREAVTNVLRHAQASTCRIRVEPAEGGVALEVADDGRGGPVGDGNGVQGMRARLREVGGMLVIESGSGVRLRATAPAAVPAA